MCDLLGCDVDYLIGRLDEKSHNTSFISQYTGLSEEAIEVLHYLNQATNPPTVGDYNKKVVSFINRVLGLSHPFISTDSADKSSAITNLFTLCEQYLSPNTGSEIKMTFAQGVNGANPYAIPVEQEIELIRIQRELFRLYDHFSKEWTSVVDEAPSGFDTSEEFLAWHDSMIKGNNDEA